MLTHHIAKNQLSEFITSNIWYNISNKLEHHELIIKKICLYDCPINSATRIKPSLSLDSLFYILLTIIHHLTWSFKYNWLINYCAEIGVGAKH